MTSIAQQHLGIAIVDDDVVYRGVISSLLTRETQFHIFEAASGQALDQILSAETIDCILRKCTRVQALQVIASYTSSGAPGSLSSQFWTFINVAGQVKRKRAIA
jgi:hypothetical protein